MCRFLKWVGYVSTAIGAILIIMAIIGGFRYHHHFMHGHMQGCSIMQHPGGDMAAKGDSASCKHAMMGKDTTKCSKHSMMGKDTTKCCKHSMMGKQDSTKSCKKQAMMCSASAPMMMGNCCQMYQHRIGFHMGLAICFLLLAIALFMICKHCHCKHCCDDKECKCETKEEKKE
jgi:hypothetical protein